jgi:hypothetical protein
MKLSNTLPKVGEETLLVVSSPSGSKFFLVKEGSLEQVAEFKIDKPHYSDLEDTEAGPLIDRMKPMVHRDFNITFKATAKKLAKTLSVKKIYLFTTKSLSNLTEKLLPAEWRNRLASHTKGDFTKVHPFQILRRVQV